MLGDASSDDEKPAPVVKKEAPRKPTAKVQVLGDSSGDEKPAPVKRPEPPKEQPKV